MSDTKKFPAIGLLVVFGAGQCGSSREAWQGSAG